jgi:D-serine deaminase-like pyridoxal phosphate-dependent protein
MYLPKSEIPTPALLIDLDLIIVDSNKIRRLAQVALKSEIIVAVDDLENIAMLSTAAVEAGTPSFICW